MNIISPLKNNYRYKWLFIISLSSYVLRAQVPQQDSCAFFGGKPIYPYYHPTQPLPAKDFYTLKKEFTAAVGSPQSFSGIITITFYINYKGETAYYETKLIDLNYQPLSPSAESTYLSGQLKQVIQRQGLWKPGRNNYNEIVNSRKFYSFKFIKGTLVEILPK